MSLFPEPQSAFDYPQRLVEKYRPRRVADFIGMPKERKIITTFLVWSDYFANWVTPELKAQAENPNQTRLV